jgi:hypothetical protein
MPNPLYQPPPPPDIKAPFLSHVPTFPALDPYALSVESMNQLVTKYGLRLQWMKSHGCPCVYGGNTPGSPDSGCLSCNGKGVIWDQPSSVFVSLLSYSGMVPSSHEPGMRELTDAGQVLAANPLLTIPYTKDTEEVWSNATMFDAFVVVDSVIRFYSNLTVGERTAVPYQQSLSFPTSGAVSIWNVQTKRRQFVPYTIDGPNVLIPGYPDGTSYMVEYYASPVMVAYERSGGLPHVRPFGAGRIRFPRRFHLKLLDLWTRSANDTDNTPQVP